MGRFVFFLFFLYNDTRMSDVNDVKEYIISCWYCDAEFDAIEAPFCNHSSPTKICPFCLHCFCDASKKYKNNFIKNSPKELLEEIVVLQEGGRPRLGEILLRAGRITERQLSDAIEQQNLVHRPLGEILLMMGLITLEELRIYLVDQQEIDEIDLEETAFRIDFSLVKQLGKEFCLSHRIIPFESVQIDNENILRFVISSKNDLARIKFSGELKDYTLIPYMTKKEHFDPLLERIKNIDDSLLK